MKMIVGVGNPGIKYKKTRHNVGFMFVESLCDKLGIKTTVNHQLKCELVQTHIKGEKVIIVKPITYMNLSGEAVLAVCKYFNVDTADILVIHDDLDLPVGKVRIRAKGSAGGQKGMKNIIDLLHTEEISRIRIGIDKQKFGDTADYVLGVFSEDDKIAIDLVTTKALEMVECFLTSTFENFMNRYNRNE